MVVRAFCLGWTKYAIYKPVDKVGAVKGFDNIFFAIVFHFPQFIAPLVNNSTFIPLETFGNGYYKFFQIFEIRVNH
jgi:hypothetical protein